MEIALAVLGPVVRGGDPVRDSRLHGQVAAGRAGPDARDARFVGGHGPGSLPDDLRRQRPCLGDGTCTGNAPQAATHQHECVLVALPENGIDGDEGWDAPMTHHICFPQGWFWFISLCSWESSPTANLTAMIGALAYGPPGKKGSCRIARNGRAGRGHAFTSHLDRRVTPGSDLDYRPPGGAPGAVLALRSTPTRRSGRSCVITRRCRIRTREGPLTVL